MKKIGMGGKYPARVKQYHSMKNIPDKFFNWFTGKTGGKFIVHTRKQLNKSAKSTLINNIVFLEKLVFNLAYELYKSKLPRLKALPKRSKKQLDNDKRLGKMSKARAKKKRVKKRRKR